MRKTLFLLTVAIGLGLCAGAQVGKGDLLVGGTLGFYNSNTNYNGASNSSANVNFNPRISYAVGNNSILGLNLGYAYNKTKATSSDNQNTTNTFSAGVFLRNLIPIKGKFGWYPEIGGNVYSGKTQYVQNNGGENTSTTKGFNAYVVPGLYYSISPAFLLNVDFGGVNFGSAKTKYNDSPSSTTNSFQFGLFQNFNFGFDFIIGRKGRQAKG
jgi:hypothetical protein